ncbi:hypothetical protein BK140_09995 [Paenibacillus macerans]|nr:hypothetical protein BK140_09995 [Paenibacillus macerans]
MFKSKDRAEAIEFKDGEPSTIKGIIKLTSLRATVEYNLDGSVRAGLIVGPTETLVVKLGQYVYRESSGKIGVCDYEQLIQKHEEITYSTTGSAA